MKRHTLLDTTFFYYYTLSTTSMNRILHRSSFSLQVGPSTFHNEQAMVTLQEMAEKRKKTTVQIKFL